MINQFTEDYIKDFKSRFTYNTNNIEGNTLTLPETVSIILDKYIPATSEREYYEIINHAKAIDYLFEHIADPIDDYFIKKLHEILLDRLNHDHGKYKEHDNKIVGADFQIPPAHEISI